jgi:hypothetical protein
MAIRFRLVGGPADGQCYQDGNAPSRFRVPVRNGYAAPHIVGYNRTPFTRDGYLLYVVDCYRGSLVSDEEIDVAAAWLGGHQAKFEAHRWGDPDIEIPLLAARFKEAHQIRFRRARDECKNPETIFGFQVHGYPPLRIAQVRIQPGRVRGYLNDEVEPSFDWPLKPDAETGRVLGRAVERAMSRIFGPSPTGEPPRAEPEGKGPPEPSGSWRDRPSML